jgi:hypothetical protein
MPRGVFVRTTQAKENMAKAKIGNKYGYRLGNTPWNKGLVSDDSKLLWKEIYQVAATSPIKLTIKETFEALAVRGILPNNSKGYRRLTSQIFIARHSGRLPEGLIIEGIAKSMRKGRLGSHKFEIGDKVRIIRGNQRTPVSFCKELRLNRCRTITGITHVKGCRYYLLGTNNTSEGLIRLFRSSELEPYIKNTSAGRPSTKRKYVRHIENTSPANDSLLVNPSESPCISCVNDELCLVK